MSRSNPQANAENPCKSKLEWVGHEKGGYFNVYNPDTKETVKLALPLRFAYLDTMKAIAGFYEKVNRGLWSNEVRYTNREELAVFYSKDGAKHPVAKGLYADIKGDLSNVGGKFCNVVYATLLSDESDDVEYGALVKIPMTGAFNSKWIDLKIKDGESFEITGYEDLKKGRTEYRAPIMEKIEITDAEGEMADEADKALQVYLDGRTTSSKNRDAEEAPPSEEDDAPGPLDDEDAPFDDNIPFD